jgi:Zn-dependent hydrolases, including glyoxylases
MTEKVEIIRLGIVNAFLVKGDYGYILFDTGLSTHWGKILEHLNSFGCTPENLKLIVLTHGDVDHAGNAARLKQHFKCPIAMHKGDLEQVRDGIGYLRKGRTMYAKIVIFTMRTLAKNFRYEPFTPDILLKNGDNLLEFGLNATIIHTPGHTRGSIGILLDNDDYISGDTFVNNSRPRLAVYVENNEELAKSYKIISKLPIRHVYPSHGKPFNYNEIAHKVKI